MGDTEMPPEISILAAAIMVGLIVYYIVKAINKRR